ncbi:MAG TPA: chemotaxis protein CheW [Gammaproteobacteria bacterium]|nr:chemotaxis protein CheW [Gammaproteobacteria bacterium]
MAQPLPELYSLLIPLAGGRMILPRTSVAEVMGYAPPRNRPANAPPWLLGMVNWQGREIPLISYEAACGQPVPEIKNRTRVTVIYTFAGWLVPNAIALATQGYPYLVRVTASVLRPDDEPLEFEGPVLARVCMANERPLIPDLERLEAMVMEALGRPIPETQEVAAAPAAAEVIDEDVLGIEISEELASELEGDSETSAAPGTGGGDVPDFSIDETAERPVSWDEGGFAALESGPGDSERSTGSEVGAGRGGPETPAAETLPDFGMTYPGAEPVPDAGGDESEPPASEFTLDDLESGGDLTLDDLTFDDAEETPPAKDEDKEDN